MGGKREIEEVMERAMEDRKKKEKARKRRIRERDVFLNQEIFPLDT